MPLRFLICLLIVGSLVSKRVYERSYHNNGKLAEEGWQQNGQKVDFWKFYHPTGKIKEKGHYKTDTRTGYWYFYDRYGKIKMEGHYKNGNMVMWWLFYDEYGKINHKCQLENGVKNGYCLKYVNEELKSAEKFKNGKKVKEWFSLASFRRENKLSDLK